MKPKNKKELIAYLTQNPNLILDHPGIKDLLPPKKEARTFVKARSKSFVFLTPAGFESYLNEPKITYQEDGFLVELEKDSFMKYIYQ